jgi:hypothetical protein
MNQKLTINEHKEAKIELEAELQRAFPFDAVDQYYQRTGIMPECATIQFTNITTMMDDAPKYQCGRVEIKIDPIKI